MINRKYNQFNILKYFCFCNELFNKFIPLFSIHHALRNMLCLIYDVQVHYFTKL